MTVTTERLTTYQDIIRSEGGNLTRLEQERAAAQDEITETESAIQTLQEELKELNEDLEEKSKKVEEVKKTTSRAAKVLDQAIKEIATHVRISLFQQREQGY